MFDTSPRVFITGASGFVGSYITRRLLKEGLQVIALRRSGSGLLPESVPGLTWVQGNITDMPLLTDLVADADWVIHAAAMVSFASSDRNLLFKTNVEGTANLVNACLQSNVQRFCFVSSVAAIGAKEEVVNERAQWEDSLNHSAYGLSKHLAEREVWRGIAEGLPAFIVNPSVVLGKNSPDSSLAKLFRMAGSMPFYPSGIINLVDATDVADGIFRLLQHNVIAERFICNAAAIRFQEFFAQIAAAMDKQPPQNRIPDTLLRLAGTVSGWLGGTFNRQTAEAACQTCRYDGSKLTAKTGLQYHPVAESIRAAVKSTLTH
jgi:nucleoside-diphosphate-sugar epimerase